MPVATISPTSTGCKVATPNLALSTPVTTGNRDPPTWANTNRNEMAVELVSGENSRDPTEMPCHPSQPTPSFSYTWRIPNRGKQRAGKET